MQVLLEEFSWASHPTDEALQSDPSRPIRKVHVREQPRIYQQLESFRELARKLLGKGIPREGFLQYLMKWRFLITGAYV